MIKTCRETRNEKVTEFVVSPVQRLSEILPLHVELEDGSLTVSGGIVAPAVLLQEGVKAVLCRVFLTAHKHHWTSGRREKKV